MRDVSLFRLYLLRATYLFIALGLTVMIWPGIINATIQLEHMRGVVRCLLGSIAVLAVIGIRYPLQMIPLLLFELIWKLIWLVAIGLPLQAANAFTPGTRSTWTDCLIGVVIVLVAIPWGYVFDNYVRRPGDRWTKTAPASAA